MPRLKWLTWVGLLGAGVASWGLIWLAISPYVAKQASRMGWLSSGLDNSTGARVMALLAVVFLAVVGSEWVVRVLGKHS
ncbi:MAG: hypothetical protein WA477_06865 [Candidatus Sulfotelmatobacter sp.]